MEPLSMDEIVDDARLFDIFEHRIERSGYLSNSVRTMAHWPEFAQSLDNVIQTIFWEGTVPRSIKMLMFLMFSSRWGCRYCQAHGASNAIRAGVSEDKLDSVWEFESSSEFNDSERVALRLARDAPDPTVIGPDRIAELEEHYESSEVVELVAVLSAAAFMNTWNSTIGTELEPMPFDIANDHLAGPIAWSPGKHERAPKGGDLEAQVE